MTSGGQEIHTKNPGSRVAHVRVGPGFVAGYLKLNHRCRVE
jgi:hypothetical protein